MLQFSQIKAHVQTTSRLTRLAFFHVAPKYSKFEIAVYRFDLLISTSSSHCNIARAWSDQAKPSLDITPSSTKMAPSTTTPTAEQIAVPETLLKKRRSNDKAREEKLAKAAEAKKVSPSNHTGSSIKAM